VCRDMTSYMSFFDTVTFDLLTSKLLCQLICVVCLFELYLVVYFPVLFCLSVSVK